MPPSDLSLLGPVRHMTKVERAWFRQRFAGAQRTYVEQVAEALKARGVRCFYDADEQTFLASRSTATGE